MTLRSSLEAARLSGPKREADGGFFWEFRFRADDPTFAGHFPGRPILPGVFQLELARAAAEWTLHCPLAVREVGRAKFTRPILPEEVIRLDLKLSENGSAVQVRASFSVAGQAAGETFLTLCRNA